MNGQPISNWLAHYRKGDMKLRRNLTTEGTLARSISKAASRQAYQTIRLLVDRDRVTDAYRAYAYIRWVDDIVVAGNFALSGAPHVFAGAVEARIWKPWNPAVSPAFCVISRKVIGIITWEWKS